MFPLALLQLEHMSCQVVSCTVGMLVLSPNSQIWLQECSLKNVLIIQIISLIDVIVHEL